MARYYDAYKVLKYWLMAGYSISWDIDEHQSAIWSLEIALKTVLF